MPRRWRLPPRRARGPPPNRPYLRACVPDRLALDAVLSRMTRAIVRPIDAAGLVLLRGSRDDPEVLLGRRHARAGFLPDIYVFPGGRVEPEDAQGEPLPLVPAVAAGLSWATRRPAAAFVRAALRETTEEAGLTLPPEAARHIDFVCRAITPTFSHRR